MGFVLRVRVRLALTLALTLSQAIAPSLPRPLRVRRSRGCSARCLCEKRPTKVRPELPTKVWPDCPSRLGQCQKRPGVGQLDRQGEADRPKAPRFPHSTVPTSDISWPLVASRRRNTCGVRPGALSPGASAAAASDRASAQYIAERRARRSLFVFGTALCRHLGEHPGE